MKFPDRRRIFVKCPAVLNVQTAPMNFFFFFFNFRPPHLMTTWEYSFSSYFILLNFTLINYILSKIILHCTLIYHSYQSLFGLTKEKFSPNADAEIKELQIMATYFLLSSDCVLAKVAQEEEEGFQRSQLN